MTWELTSSLDAAAVLDRLSDRARATEYSHGLRAAKKLTSEPRGVGTVFLLSFVDRTQMIETVAEYEPGKRYVGVVEHEKADVRTTFERTTSDDGSTRVRVTVDMRFHGLHRRILRPLFVPIIRRQFRADMQRLERWLAAR